MQKISYYTTVKVAYGNSLRNVNLYLRPNVKIFFICKYSMITRFVRRKLTINKHIYYK